MFALSDSMVFIAGFPGRLTIVISSGGLIMRFGGYLPDVTLVDISIDEPSCPFSA